MSLITTIGTLTLNHPEWKHVNGFSWGSDDSDEPYIQGIPEIDGWEYLEQLGDTPSIEDIFNQLN